VSRRVLLSIGIAVVAALTGLGRGLVVHRAAHGTLVVSSTWSRRTAGVDFNVTAGALAGDRRRGFVLFEVSGRPPELFTTPEGAGALRLTSATSSEWILRSRSGALAVVENERSGIDDPSLTYTYFGKPLNPHALGAIDARGIAVPLRYGPPAGKEQLPRYKAVLLVGRTGDAAGPGTWTVEGYLPGFALPRAAGRTHELERPLLGPDHRLYTIDARSRRLVDAGAGGREAVWAPGYQAGCSTWPSRQGATIAACPGFVVLHRTDGTATTLLRRTPAPRDMSPGWGLVSTSADGRWLLLEDETQSCGTATSAYLLPAAGGYLVPAVRDVGDSQALGWLRSELDTALIMVQGDGCDGRPPSGIYAVRPYLDAATESAVTERVLLGRVHDATTWGGL
jgi:hypothetical protein